MFTLTRAITILSALWFQTPVGTSTPTAEPTTAGGTATVGGTAAAGGTATAGAAGASAFPILPALGVLAGLIFLIILILLAARIFGRRGGRPARAARGSRAALAGAAAGSKEAVSPAGAFTGGRGPGAAQSGAAQAGAAHAARWLARPDGQKISLSKLPLTIGRDKSNQVVIDNPSLADVHARIYLDETENVVCIEDASEGNSAVLVNGSPTRKNILSDNDRISLGDVTLQYHEAVSGQNAAAQG